jgi:DNA-binding transcriptional ArsR family regulator
MPPAVAEDATDVFAALAHPLRRRLLDDLAAGELPVNALAGPHSVSRPAVSQHLRILLESGLVAERRDGRERRYRLVPERLHDVSDWLSTYERFWKRKLRALEAHLEENDDPDRD